MALLYITKNKWVSIRGQDATKPVLLFLAGGPGGSQLATARYALGGLEEHFVVVNWEQPGSGKSFDAVERATMTPERYIADAHALVLLLRERFGQDKVYVLGESWGSALGVMLVQRYPELFHAFVGTGQMVAFLENDLMCYDFALNWARERGDAKKVETLIRQGPPAYLEELKPRFEAEGNLFLYESPLGESHGIEHAYTHNAGKRYLYLASPA